MRTITCFIRTMCQVFMSCRTAMYSSTCSTLYNFREHCLPAVGWQQSCNVKNVIPFLQPIKWLSERLWDFPKAHSQWMAKMQLWTCLTAETDSLMPLDSSPTYFCHATQSPAANLSSQVCLQFSRGLLPKEKYRQTRYNCRGGHWARCNSHRPCGARHAFSQSPVLSMLISLSQGVTLPAPCCIMGEVPIHPPAGCQTRHGRRPQRGALIQRKKPLREL